MTIKKAPTTKKAAKKPTKPAKKPAAKVFKKAPAKAAPSAKRSAPEPSLREPLASLKEETLAFTEGFTEASERISNSKKRQSFLCETTDALHRHLNGAIRSILDQANRTAHWAAARAAVEQWLSGATAVETAREVIAVPTLDEDLRKEIKRLLSITKIVAVSFKNTSSVNNTLRKSLCTFAIGKWKSQATWSCEANYFPPHSEIECRVEGFDEDSPCTEVRRQIKTTLPSLVLRMYVFLIGFDLLDRCGYQSDHRPDGNEYFPWLSEQAIREWRPGMAEPD